MGAKKPLLATTRQSRGVLRKMKTRLVSNTKSELPTKPKATPAKSEKQVRKTDNKESQQAKQSVTQRSASATPSSAKVVKKESTQTSSLSSSSTSGQDRKASLASPGGQQSTVAPKPSLIASSTPKKVQQQVADAQQPKPDEDKAKAINKMLKSLDIKISGFKNIIPDEQKSVECKASISEIVKTKSRAAAAKVGTVSSTKSTRKGGAGSQEGGKKPSGAGGKPAEKTKTGERRDDDGKDETSAVCLKTKDMKNPQSTADGKVKEKSEVDELKSQSTRRGEDRDTESTSRVTHFLVANAFQEHVNKKFEGAGEIQSGRDEGATSKASNLPPTQPAKIGTGQAKPRSNDGNKTNALLGGSNRSRKKEQVKKDNNQQVDKATAKQSKKGKKTPPDKSATEIDAKSIPQKPDSVLTNAGDNSMLHSENVSSSACDEERVDKNIASSEDNEGKSSKIDKLNEVLPVKNTATKKSSSKSRNNTRVQKKTGAMSKTTKTGEISSIEKDEKEEKRPPIEVTAQSESKELKNSKEDEQKKIAAAAARKYKSKNKGACNEGLSPLNLTVTDEGTGGKIPLKEAQNTVKAPNEPEKSVSTKTALGDKASTNKTSSLEPVKGLQEKRSEAKAANETPSQKCSLTSGPLPGDANPRENENSAPNSEQEDTPLEDAGLATSLPQTVSSKSNSPLLSQQSKLLTVRERLQKKYIQNRATTTGFRSFKLTRQAKPIKIAMKVKPQKSVSKSKKDTTDEEDKIEKKEKDVYDFKTESESDDNIKMNLLGESSILSKICLEKDFSDEDDRPLQLTKIQLKEEQEEKAAKLLFDEQEKLANEKLNELKVKTEKKTQTPKKGAEKKSVTLVVHQEGKKQTRQPKKPTTSKRKERTGSSTSSTSNTDTESDESSSSDSRLRKMSFGPKRHRMASLNALAKVQCLYENESKTAHELGLSKTAQIPRIRLIQSGSSSDEEKEIDKKSLDLKNIKKEEPEVENKRELRNAPGLRGIGKHWDFNDVSSFESGHESDVTFKGRLDSKPKNKKRKVPKPKVTSSAKDKEKEKTEPKAKKVVSKPPQKKKPRSPPPPRHSSSDSSDDDDNSKSSDEHLQGNKKRKREKTDDIASDLKQMLVHKRMAGLNASAIVAATYEVERHLDRNLNSDCSSFESFPEDEKPIIVNPPKKAKDIKKDKSEDAKCNSKDAKESGGKDSSRPTSSSVVIVQDTDVTITGVYVNSSTGSSQEAYCKMQYRVQSSVTEERVLRPSSIDPPKSYTPLGALSSMRPPGAAVPPEGQQHTSPPQQPSGQQAGVQPPPSANIYQSPTISQELSQPSGHVYAPVHHHPGSPMGPTHQHQSEQQQPPPPLHHHHHPQQQPKYPPHLARHHHHQQPHQPTPLAQSRCESPVRYQSGPYQSVQPTIPPSLTMPGSGSSAFCAPMQQPHHDMSGYYQPAGPLISPHVLPPVPPSNAALVSTKQVPSPLDSDPDQLQQPPPSTSAAESSDSEVLITGGDLTTFRYPTQQQQAQSQQLSALSSQQQSQQGSPYPRSMHQMHYPPAYPPSYYSPYPGDAMCYSPPYQPYFPTKVYQSAPAYRRYPSYYQPGHPPPSELYEPAPPSSAAPPPPSGSQLVPSGPTAPQHMDHYPGPPGFYAGYSPGGGQCYSRGMQPPYMEYPPPCPCPMQSCPKNVLTGPLIGSNSSGSSSSNTNSSSSASNTLSTSNSSSNNSNNSISNSSNTANSSLSNLSQPLKASKGPGQQVQHSIKTHGHMMGGMDATAQLSNGSILGKPHLHRHHVHQCKMELLEPMKPELKKEINDTLISDDNTKSSQYEEMAVPPTPPSSYTVNDKLIEPEITVSPARGSTGLPTVPDQTDKAASTPTIINSPQPPMAATIPRESGETGVNSSNLAPTIGRKARLGKTMAREMMYGAHALQHHHPQHPQIFSHTHIHHHIPSHNPQPEMIPMSTQIVDANASIMQSDYSKIKTEEIKKEEEDIVVILDDEKKIKTEPEVVEVFDESSTKFDKSDSASNEPPVNLETSGAEDEDIPRHGSAKRMKILELNKAQCKKSPPNGYKSLIKQADPKPYLCLSRKSDKKDRYAKITSRGGVRKRKLMLTEQQKKRLIMRKRKLMLEKKKQKAERAARNKSTVSSTMSTVAFGASNSLKDADAEGQEPPSTVRPAQAAMDQSSHQPADLLPATPLEHTIDCVARGYFSEPEIRSSAGRKAKKTKSSEVRSKSETKKSPEQQLTSRRSVESVTTVTTSPTKVSSGQHRHKPIWRDSANDEPQTEHPRTDSKKRRREKSSSKTKSNKSSAKRAKSSNADCLSAEISEDLTQSSVEGSTGVTINNNVLETNNNQLPDDVAEEGKTPQAAEHPLPSDEMFQPVGQRQPSKRTRSRSKFGNRRRQRARHPANNQIVDPVVIPRKLNVVPRWNNGWSWEGQPFQGKVFLNSDDPLVVRTCYPAMRHEEGDVVRPRDCVLLRAGTKKNELPYVAKVAHLWENPEDGEMMMSLLWYYRPEHTEQGRQSNDNSDEVFASRHRDHNSVACIEDKCYVLTFSEYCRYRRIVRAAEEEIDEEVSVVPSLSNSYHFRQVPVSTNPEQVLFCQRVYDFRLKRLMKTSSNN